MGNQNFFENNIARLEQIVRALEQGDAPLEASLKLFQEGTDLVSKCQDLLDQAQLQVKIITEGNDGMPVEGEFDAKL